MKKHANKTNQELLAERAAIEADQANRMPPGGLYIYTPKARKKLDAITRAITANMAEQRAQDGRPVPTCGYSGRQTNRR